MKDRKTFLRLVETSDISGLKCIHKNLRKRNIHVEYLMTNMETKESNILKKYSELFKIIANEKNDWISIDGFLPEELTGIQPEQRKILLLEPNKRLFNTDWNEEQFAKLTKGFTDLVIFSSYWAEKIKSYKAAEKIRIWDNVKYPLLEAYEDADLVNEAKEKVYARFPQICGKKILYIYLTGNRLDEDAVNYSQVDLRKVLDSLPEDVVLVTNSLNLRYAGRMLNASFKNKFIFVSGSDLRNKMMVLAEYVITNNMYVSVMAHSCNKQHYVLQFSGNDFEKYIGRYHKDLLISNAGMLEEWITSIKDNIMTQKEIPEMMMDGKISIMEILDMQR